MLYRASADYTKLADSTRKNWSPWLDRIADYFGELRIAQFDRPKKLGRLSAAGETNGPTSPHGGLWNASPVPRALHAVDPLGKIAGNPCEGIKQLYSGDRSEIIWTKSDIAALKKTCSPEIAHAVDLAAHTGLRLGDLLRLSWSHVGEDAITIATARAAADAKQSFRFTTIYGMCSRGFPSAHHDLNQQQAATLDTRRIRIIVQHGKERSRHCREDLHFHDLRGTAATKFYIAGLSSASSRKFSHGTKIRLSGSSGVMWLAQRLRKAGHPAAQRGQKENITCKTRCKTVRQIQLSVGAGEGNRTLVCSLGSCRSAIELRPRDCTIPNGLRTRQARFAIGHALKCFESLRLCAW